MRSVVILLCCSSLLLPAAESDALAISANIQARHVPFGTILDPIFSAPDSTQITGYTRCADSAIWTGHYLAAEAYRYKVTRSPDALANAQAALGGLKMLADVTGTNLLARCAVPVGSDFAPGIAQEEKANGVWFGSANGKAYMWIGHTSRDEYSGVFFGLGVAYDMIDDPGVRAEASALATRLLQFLIDARWNIIMPDFSVSTTFLIRPDQQLALLQVGRHLNPASSPQKLRWYRFRWASMRRTRRARISSSTWTRSISITCCRSKTVSCITFTTKPATTRSGPPWRATKIRTST